MWVAALRSRMQGLRRRRLWMQRLRRLRFGRLFSRNYVSGLCRLHWVSCWQWDPYLGPVDQRLLLGAACGAILRGRHSGRGFSF